MSTTDTPQVSRGLLVALAAVAGVGLLVLAYLFVLQPLLDDSEEVAVTTPTTEPTPTPGVSPTPTDDETDPEPVPETFDVFTARDPFQQLVVPAASSGGSPSPSPTGTTSPSPTTSPTTSPSPTTPSDVTVGATTVRLVDVFTEAGTDKALVTVNGVGYEVAEGETFAQRFRLLDITGQCATMLFGDSRFTLCEGETIRK